MCFFNEIPIEKHKKSFMNETLIERVEALEQLKAIIQQIFMNWISFNWAIAVISNRFH